MDTDVTESSTFNKKIDEYESRRQVVELAPIPTFEDLSTPVVVANDAVRMMITVFSHDTISILELEANQIITHDKQEKRRRFMFRNKTSVVFYCVENGIGYFISKVIG